MLGQSIGWTGWLLSGALMACNASSSGIPQMDGSGGGSDTGGSDTGGSDTGGSNTGGSNTGGSDTGGSNTGGAGNAGGSGGAGGATNAGGSSADGGSSAGASGPCVVGDAGCDCYPNDTCNQDLHCEGGTCEAPSSGGASSGSGGTGAANGSGGATSAGGSASTSGGGTTAGGAGNGTTGPVVPGTAILPVDGWVDASTNSVGVQGYWYTYGDGISVVVPSAEPFFAGQGTNLCISGSVPATGVEPEVWGVAMGMDLNVQTPEDTAGDPYDATAHDVVGFRFTLNGTLPASVQINFPDPNGYRYCQRFYGVGPSQETLSVYIADADFECWLGADLPPSGATIQGFHVQVIPDHSVTVNFDFCLTNIQAIAE